MQAHRLHYSMTLGQRFRLVSIRGCHLQPSCIKLAICSEFRTVTRTTVNVHKRWTENPSSGISVVANGSWVGVGPSMIMWGEVSVSLCRVAYELILRRPTLFAVSHCQQYYRVPMYAQNGCRSIAEGPWDSLIRGPWLDVPLSNAVQALCNCDRCLLSVLDQSSRL